jgi:hypothetical protein
MCLITGVKVREVLIVYTRFQVSSKQLYRVKNTSRQTPRELFKRPSAYKWTPTSLKKLQKSSLIP